MTKPIAVSMGEPAGIGPDIILQAYADHRNSLPPFITLCDVELMQSRAKEMGVSISFEKADFNSASAVFSDALPVLPLEHKIVLKKTGAPDSRNAKAVVEAIDKGVAATLAKKAAALVTAPIQKKTLYDDGFSFPGHTEYLDYLAEKHLGKPVRAVMMLAGPMLRTVPVTVHIPLADVPKKLTEALIVKTAHIVAQDLIVRFGVPEPRIAVAGLNPHAGEDGTLGREDMDIIAPAVNNLRAQGVNAFGPLPADTMFHERARARYDVALCMYHDQALIPVKALAFDETVNVTLGLPFIRTSPDHGTALDIAGTGTANPSSFIASLRMAGELAGLSW
jgi:4-hydroxythreonine-4-phosphate dehydrogenase